MNSLNLFFKFMYTIFVTIIMIVFKHHCMTGIIKGWYNEAIKVTREFKVLDIRFIIYKGFKISKKNDDEYILQDVRYEEHYTTVSVKEFALMQKKGFVRAVDEVNHLLNLQRVKEYTKKIEFLYAKRKKAKTEMRKDVRLNKKRIKLANKNIDILVDQMFLFQSRIEQFNNKYNKT